MARDFFDLWDIVRIRRSEFDHWELPPRPERHHNVNPNLHMAWAAAERNVGRFRRRWLRARASPLSEAFGPISQETGSGLQVPSDYEINPVEPRGTLSLPPPFDFVGSGSGPQRANGNDVPILLVQTPKLPGIDRDAPPPQRARTISQKAK